MFVCTAIPGGADHYEGRHLAHDRPETRLAGMDVAAGTYKNPRDLNVSATLNEVKSKGGGQECPPYTSEGFALGSFQRADANLGTGQEYLSG